MKSYHHAVAVDGTHQSFVRVAMVTESMKFRMLSKVYSDHTGCHSINLG